MIEVVHYTVLSRESNEPQPIPDEGGEVMFRIKEKGENVSDSPEEIVVKADYVGALGQYAQVIGRAVINGVDIHCDTRYDPGLHEENDSIGTMLVQKKAKY